MFETKPGNGEIVARIQIPPIREYLVTRQDKHGGNVVVHAHTLGLGRGGALVCYTFTAGVDTATGDPMLEQQVTRIFHHFNDVEQIDIPSSRVTH